MILAETSLSFLGIGLQPPVVSWGVLLQEAQNVHAVATRPGCSSPAPSWSSPCSRFNFLGDGLRDAADPYASMKGPAHDHEHPARDPGSAGRISTTRANGVVRAVDGARPDAAAQPDPVRASANPAAASPSPPRSILQIVEQARPHRRRRDPLPRPRRRRRRPRRARRRTAAQIRAIRGGDIAMIFQEPMTSLSPVHTDRRPDRRDDPAAPGASARRGRASATVGDAAAGSASRTRERARHLSVRALRRHAPARHDRAWRSPASPTC